MAAGVCAFAEIVSRFAETAKGDAMVFSTACDQLRRSYDAATFHSPARAFLFNQPATLGPAARHIYHDELLRLGDFLGELGGHPPTLEVLRREIARANQARQQLLTYAAHSPAHSFAAALAQYHDSGRASNLPPLVPPGKVPLALVGGPFVPANWHLFHLIEQAGGRIALNATESGERSLLPTIDCPEDKSPFAALADGYFERIADAFQRPHTRLYEWLKPRLEARQVRGIILWQYTGCDLWRAEAQTLSEVFQLPVILLEGGAEPGANPRDENRLQAFVETLS
jgi:benzoyl-CoA reductase/2-hydroxyglutaryl-CoA dehydratase subunit BcrC/BadD/HgdB